MKITMQNKKISGILCVIPQNEYSVLDELDTASSVRAKRLKKIMGFDRKRRSKKETTISKAYSYILDVALEKEYFEKSDIGAIVTVTLTPDYFAPSPSEMIHEEFDLGDEVKCFDVPSGCMGYILGILQAFMLADKIRDKKILIFTGDIFNRINSDEEQKTCEPQFGGDAIGLTVVEYDEGIGKSYFNIYSDGKGREALLMLGGALANPVFKGDDVILTDAEGNHKYKLGIGMEGSDVFNFIAKEVPPLIKETVEFADKKIDEVDWFLFHQPNRFILEKLAQKLEINYEKIPMNIVEKYGNSNSSTIPMVIADNISDQMKDENYTCCLSGFGSGLSWGAIILEIGKMDFCELLEADL